MLKLSVSKIKHKLRPHLNLNDREGDETFNVITVDVTVILQETAMYDQNEKSKIRTGDLMQRDKIMNVRLKQKRPQLKLDSTSYQQKLVCSSKQK